MHKNEVSAFSGRSSPRAEHANRKPYGAACRWYHRLLLQLPRGVACGPSLRTCPRRCASRLQPPRGGTRRSPTGKRCAKRPLGRPDGSRQHGYVVETLTNRMGRGGGAGPPPRPAIAHGYSSTKACAKPAVDAQIQKTNRRRYAKTCAAITLDSRGNSARNDARRCNLTKTCAQHIAGAQI